MIRPLLFTSLVIVALTTGCYEKATLHGIGGDQAIDPDSLNASKKPAEQVNPLTGMWMQDVAEGAKPWTLELGGNNDFTARDGRGKAQFTGRYQYAQGGNIVRFTSSRSSPACPGVVGLYELRYTPTRIEFQLRTDECSERKDQWAFAWIKKENQ